MRPCLISTLAMLTALVVLSAGCDPGRAEREAMGEQIKALQKENAELKQQLAALQRVGPRSGSGGSPLAGLAGLLGQLDKGNFKVNARPAPGRTAPMDPNLQKRVDRMMVEALEKLSQNKDAKELVKAMMQAMRRDLQRQAEKPPRRR